MSIAETSAFQRPASAGRYPINLRMTIPFFPRKLFITIIVGQEKRGRDRLAEERARHPINTWGNVLTVTVTLAVVSVAALFAALIAATA